VARTRRNRRKSEKPALPKLPKLPPVPRPRINWQALMTVGAISAVAAISVALGRELLDLPLRHLDIKGQLQRVTKLQISAAAKSVVGDQGFLTVDLDEVREEIASIDWVDTVTLQRIWPDTLSIAYTEHRAAARWGDSGLLNTRGELFSRAVRREYLELPKLAGPEGSHLRVAEVYLDVRDRLARANLRLDSIRMDARGAFSIELVGGISIRIGRDDVAARIDRFFDVAVAELETDLDRVAYVDMRYPKGFAVGWIEAGAENG
jgi:cell division protein FtsQ